MEYFRDKYLKDKNDYKILDIGSRNVDPSIQKDYRYIFQDKHRYYGMDIEPGHNVDIVGFDELNKVGTFDVVISGQTLEHVKRPWDWLKMISQFSDKWICIIAPHTFHEHRFPIDTYRYFPDGMRDLFEYAGIKEIEIIKNKIDTMGVGIK